MLNSQEAANELLVKRSLIYSDRPQIPMVSSDKLVGWGNFIAMLRYGDQWRFQRKVIHEALQKIANEARWPLIERDSRLLLQRILANPDNFSQDLRHMTGSTLLTAVYGYEVTLLDDTLFKLAEDASQGFLQAVVVPNFLVNTFPWLELVPEWFPGANWKAKAKIWRNLKDQMLQVPFEWTKSRMATGKYVPSMLSTWLNRYMNQEPNLNLPINEVEEYLRWAAGAMFAAGSDTTVASLRTFIIAMAMHPDIQAKAQAQIDSSIGTRLPGLADQDSLPYVRCIVKEVLRWRMPAPLALPHGCIQDDTFRGYQIPEGAIVLGNAWAIANDPTVYPDPDRFNPDRFLDPSVPDSPAFGFGRRMCPGLHHAEAVLFITAAGLLAMFDIRPEEDENGNPIQLKAETKLNEVLRHLLQFKCRITPRSEKHELIVREWAKV